MTREENRRRNSSEDDPRSVVVRCPECRQKLRVRFEGGAQEVTCDCGATFEIAPRQTAEQKDEEEVSNRPRRKRGRKSGGGFSLPFQGLFGMRMMRLLLGIGAIVLLGIYVIVPLVTWFVAPYRAIVQVGSTTWERPGWSETDALFKAVSRVSLSDVDAAAVVVDPADPLKGKASVTVQVTIRRSGYTAYEAFHFGSLRVVRKSESSAEWKFDMEFFKQAYPPDKVKLHKLAPRRP